MPEYADDEPGPEDVALTRIEMDEVYLVLEMLPERQRSIVEFRIAGLTTREISDVLGMSISAVKSAQTRAYTQIRTQLLRTGERS